MGDTKLTVTNCDELWKTMPIFPYRGQSITVNAGFYDETHFCQLQWPSNLQVYDCEGNNWTEFKFRNLLKQRLKKEGSHACFKLFTNYNKQRSIILSTEHYIAEYNTSTKKFVMIKDLKFVGNYFIYYVDSKEIHLIDHIGHYIVSKHDSSPSKVKCIHIWKELTYLVSSRIIYSPNEKQVFIFGQDGNNSIFKCDLKYKPLKWIKLNTRFVSSRTTIQTALDISQHYIFIIYSEGGYIYVFNTITETISKSLVRIPFEIIDNGSFVVIKKTMVNKKKCNSASNAYISMTEREVDIILPIYLHDIIMKYMLTDYLHIIMQRATLQSHFKCKVDHILSSIA